MIPLDYNEAATIPLLNNISGVAGSGDQLWTVSDEGRTVECLRAEGDGYVLTRQVKLDHLKKRLPGARNSDEFDLESLDFVGNQLWVCGSHCNVRRQSTDPGKLDTGIRARPSRHLLAALNTAGTDHAIKDGSFLPFDGKRSLRRHLSTDRYLKPFLRLPSKENGLDIEGMAKWRNHLLLGLRGPRLDSMAVVVAMELNGAFRIKRHSLCLLDLGGLAVRDLARFGEDVMVLAGPVGDAPGPFQLYRWQPQPGNRVQAPLHLFTWPESGEKPEAIAALRRNGATGLIVLNDSPDKKIRIRGSVFRADWLSAL